MYMINFSSEITISGECFCKLVHKTKCTFGRSMAYGVIQEIWMCDTSTVLHYLN